MMMKNTFDTKTTLNLANTPYEIFKLPTLEQKHRVSRLPFSLKILLENLLRHEDGINVTPQDIKALLHWEPSAVPSTEIAFTPSRVILQDFTGVPAIVDLASMRQAMKDLNQQPNKINPLSPVSLVIDHSVMADNFGTKTAFEQNTQLEIERNQERYAFLKWGQASFDNFQVVPPGTGIVHQVNLEYLAQVVFTKKPLINKNTQNTQNNQNIAYLDTLVGTDSHTTMINGLGVLGWGVGGIEAEAAMLGQPISMLIPQVVGLELTGKLTEGVTATDLVLVITQILRARGVVGKFVEFFGEGLQHLSLADRATIANMAPEFGATCAIFPIDSATLDYLALTGRDETHITQIEQYCKAQGVFHTPQTPKAEYSDNLTLDLSIIAPCLSGPKRPQDNILLKNAKTAFQKQSLSTLKTPIDLTTCNSALNEGAHILPEDIALKINGVTTKLNHGAVVIAAITSCTNTSNPAVMLAAGLLAKKANEQGLTPKPWVKTSLAPGSQVVIDYLQKANLIQDLEALGFHLVGFGCTTCIGNSGPLPKTVSQAIQKGNLSVAAVLSGNRNFEGRIHPEVRNAYLASPPLVVAYALAGTMDIDLTHDPIGQNPQGKNIYLKDIWPTNAEINEAIKKCVHANMFTKRYANVFKGNQDWQNLPLSQSELYNWDSQSTYVKRPPFFENISLTPSPLQDIENAHVLAKLGDFVTTDHISPAGSIDPNTPAGQYLIQQGINPSEFNSYGSRRGNHEVMIRGTFANIRLRNQLAPNTEGGITTYHPTQTQMSIFEAAQKYQQDNIPLIVLAGKEYGTGSSRDWAAKGTKLLGVKAVIAESFERIHRSNLIGMGVLPLEFTKNENCDKLNLTGQETFSFTLKDLTPQSTLKITAKDASTQKTKTFTVKIRIDTPKELEYYQHGGILHYVLRRLAKN